MASLMVRVRRLVQSRANGIFSHRSFSSPAHPIPVTLIPGDGIGPEIADSVKQVFTTADVPITWEEQYMGEEIDPRTQSFLTRDNVESVKKNKFALKGPMTTPIGKGFRSLNYLTMRKELNLYANVRPCFSLPGYKTKYDNVDLITIRENTEGEYSGLEHVHPLYFTLFVIYNTGSVVESLKIIITRHASLRVAEYAFRYAKEHGRERVSAIHKANIMQKTDGLFLKLVQDPSLFDVLVMPNLYGDIISDLCAGLIGGLGLTPRCIYVEYNKANPTALLLSGVMMLRHMDLHDKADRIQEAVFKTIAEGKYRTEDLGGKSTTTDFTKAICDHL
ncbi:hypothetical protein MIMGU_mgv1a008944mg [Erythranthe guttata]|uniref:Isopropylmalate dehydrogenase-like domain-containing protein n=1 Tax=Erythranthe guttata TaxID=4155 RepID=A0A022R6G5_ERYGU|nr:hypothetical protein MIMGU_mgv1a008944mg [Erythranthe guttata]